MKSNNVFFSSFLPLLPDVSPWSPNINMDRLLAQELEKADKETQRLQEEQEFELLKV